jgi:hypothetical protein
MKKAQVKLSAPNRAHAIAKHLIRRNRIASVGAGREQLCRPTRRPQHIALAN